MPLGEGGSGEAFCSMCPVLPVQEAEIDPSFPLRLNDRFYAQEGSASRYCERKECALFLPSLELP